MLALGKSTSSVALLRRGCRRVRKARTGLGSGTVNHVPVVRNARLDHLAAGLSIQASFVELGSPKEAHPLQDGHTTALP